MFIFLIVFDAAEVVAAVFFPVMIDGPLVEDLVLFPVCGFLFFGDAFEGAAGVEAFEEVSVQFSPMGSES